MIEWVVYFILAVAVYYWATLPPKGYPPGPPIKPLIGSFPLKAKPLHDMMLDLKKEYGPVVGMKLFNQNMVLVTGPKEVKEVLKHEKMQGRPNFDRNKNNPRKGIMFSNYNSYWLEQRKFTVKHMRDFGFGKTSMEDVVLEEADELAVSIRGKSRVQVNGLFTASSINVLWAMMSGKRFSFNDPQLKKLHEGLDKAFHTPPKPLAFLRSMTIMQKLFPKWSGAYEADEIERNLNEFFQKTFDEHKATRSDVPRDFIDVYLAALENPYRKPSFSEEAMMAVCMDLFSGGAESVSNTLAFCVLYLVLYPEWQEKVFQEVDSVLGKEGRPRLKDRKEFPKLDAFLSEVNRINTIAPLSVPRLATDDTHLGEYFIPKGTALFPSQWSCLHDKEHWGDPENFRPERFLNEDGSCRKDDYLQLFGGGKRICIGDNFSREYLFLYFTDLVQKFEFKIPEGHPRPSTIGISGSTVSPQPFEVDIRRR